MSGMTASKQPTFIDIGVNLTDPVFRGSYHGKTAHRDDFDVVLQRARKAGVARQIVTAGSLKEAREVMALCDKYEDFFGTIGCHPTRTSEFGEHPQGPEGYLAELSALLEEYAITTGGGKDKGKGKAVAIGECGLDYDRLHFADAAIQRKNFALQLTLAEKFRLPLFLHMRAAAADFMEILEPRLSRLSEAIGSGQGMTVLQPSAADAPSSSSSVRGPLRIGVVHSFTGTVREMEDLLSMGLFIGVNGCSLKTPENLEAVKALPLSHLMLETDAPWCEVRPTHAASSHFASFSSKNPTLAELYSPASVKKEKWTEEKTVKGRCEPCAIGIVAAVVAEVKGVSIEEVAEAALRNTQWLFGL